MSNHPAEAFDRRLDRFALTGLTAGLLSARLPFFRDAPSFGFLAIGFGRIGNPDELEPFELDRRMSIIEEERGRLASRDLAFVDRYYDLATTGMLVSKAILLGLTIMGIALVVLGHRAYGILTTLTALSLALGQTTLSMTPLGLANAEPPKIVDTDVKFDWDGNRRLATDGANALPPRG